MSKTKTMQIGTPRTGAESCISGGTQPIGNDHRETRTLLRTFRRFAISLLVLMAMAAPGAEAQPATVKIVGLGATRCAEFTSDLQSTPAVRRDYLAWAQGYMSGILVGRPPGTDTGLDLNPPTFGLLTQLKFLEDHCAGNPGQDFSDAVEALYRQLRKEGRT